MTTIQLRKTDTDAWLRALRSRRVDEEANARRVAASIIERVERGGDREVCGILREIDGIEMNPGDLVMRPGEGGIDEPLKRAVNLAIERVTAYHELQRPEPAASRLGDLEQQYVPLDRVGIYVPGGSAVYLSSLVMCAVPARIAGVRELVVATTPRVAAMSEFQWACRRLGVEEVLQVGGATGIAVMALGTESVKPVQKIVGPGNAYVNEAKKLVRDRVGIDLPAGPSEIVVICDETADVRCVAADMLAQAEHGSDSIAVCLTDSESVARAVEAEIERRLECGAERARAAIEAFGAVVVVDDLDEAMRLADEIAPEHLSIQVADPKPIVDGTRNCAAIFVGRAAAVALGDYVAGSNHVLPTGGTARFCSSLGIGDFLKRRSVVRISDETLEKIGPAAVAIAEFEGLELHAESVRARLGALTARAVGEPTVVPNATGTRAGVEFVPDAIRAMSAYTLDPRLARDKLDQNESAFDVPVEIKRRVMEKMVERPWNQYPDFEAVEIRDAIAKHAGATRDNVLVGNGSNELLMVTMATLVREGTPVVMAVPTFPLYEKFATIFGGVARKVELDPAVGTLPVDAMLDVIRDCDQPPIVIVCSPNNPTGGVIRDGDLERLLDSGAFVILDRAYGEFWDDGAPSPRERLVVLSTLSKAWGIASLRVGWMLSTSEICREIRKVKLPYNLNAFSQAAAIAMLEDREALTERIRVMVSERDRLGDALSSTDGIEVFPSKANFLTFRIATGADELFERILSEGILIRNVSHYPGLSGCLRVSAGTPEQNDRFIAAVRGIRSESAPEGVV